MSTSSRLGADCEPLSYGQHLEMCRLGIPGFTGYHRVDAEGRPGAWIFPGTAAAFGVPASVVLSHALLEMLANPWSNSTVVYDSGQGFGALYALEVCYPVQGNAYLIEGISVSNFLLPNHFRPTSSPP